MKNLFVVGGAFDFRADFPDCNLIARDAKTGQLRVLNKSSDGRERAVANVLGVSVRGSLRVPG